MSIKTMSAVFCIPRSANLRAIDRLVLIALADHANAENECNPAFRKIAEKCGTSRGVVITTINNLRSLGFVSSESHKRKNKAFSSNLYILLIENWPQENPAEKEGGSAPRRTTLVRPDVLASEPSVETSEKPQKTNAAKRGGVLPAKKDFPRFVDMYTRMWNAKYGDKYPFAKKDGVLMDNLWKKLGQDIAKGRRLFQVYLANDEKFFEGHPIDLLVARLPKFMVLAKPAAKSNYTNWLDKKKGL
jgi:hypothetical protein